MTIKNGKVVDMTYQLKNDGGEVLDEADAQAPFTYLHGASQIVPGLEKALEGMDSGQKKSVTVPPAEGYGEIDPGLRVVAARTQFPKGVEVKEGMRFRAQVSPEQDMFFVVEKIDGDKIHINANHPLAGETLHFEVEIIGVRDATEEELTHGHAHGADGHEHHHDHDDEGHEGHHH